MILTATLLATWLPFATASDPVSVPVDDSVLAPDTQALDEGAAKDGVHREWIAADADWVLRLDARALLSSTLAPALDDLWESDNFLEMQAEFGIDPRRDLGAVTLYGSAEEPEQAVALMEGGARLAEAWERASERLAGEAHLSTVTMGSIALQRWSQDSGASDAMFTYLAQHSGSDQRLLIVSGHKESAAIAVAVLRGDVDSLLDDSNTLASKVPSAGAFFYAAVNERFRRFEELDSASPWAQMVENAALEIGESDGDAFLGITVGTSDVNTARQLAATLLGFSTLLNTAAQSDEMLRSLLPLLVRLSVQSEGTDVNVRVDYPLTDLLQLAHELDR